MESRTAGDLMQTEIFSVPSTLPLPELESLFFERRVSGFPVVDDGRLVGVVSRLDVVRGLAVERSRAGELSDYYRDLWGAGPDADRQSFAAIAADVGVRLASLCVRDVMAHLPVTVAPEASLKDVARALLEHGIHRVPVVEDETLVGIITSLDLVQQIADGHLR